MHARLLAWQICQFLKNPAFVAYRDENEAPYATDNRVWVSYDDPASAVQKVSCRDCYINAKSTTLRHIKHNYNEAGVVNIHILAQLLKQGWGHSVLLSSYQTTHVMFLAA